MIDLDRMDPMGSRRVGEGKGSQLRVSFDHPCDHDWKGSKRSKLRKKHLMDEVLKLRARGAFERPPSANFIQSRTRP